MRIGDQEFNRLKVLKALLRFAPIARTDLARLTGLSGGSITEIIGDLLSRNLLVEEKVPAKTRGRPRINLQINPEGGYVLGAFLGVEGRLDSEIVNLKGETVFSHSSPLPPTNDLEAWALSIADIIDCAITASPLAKNDINRVGVGLPVIVDSRKGIIHNLPGFKPGPCAIADIIGQRLHLPVTIDNDLNVIARAEHWFGSADAVDDFTVALMGLGLSTASYVDGHLAIGIHGLNSGLAHAKIVPEDGVSCHCGGRGCLSAYGSISGIINMVFAARQLPAPDYRQMPELYRILMAQARAGDRVVLGAFERAGRYLGVGMANHVNAQDPGRILLLFSEPDSIEFISPSFLAALHENTLPSLQGLTRIDIAPLHDDYFLRGSSALVLEQTFLAR